MPMLARHLDKLYIALRIGLIPRRESEHMLAVSRRRVPELPEAPWPIAFHSAFNRSPHKLVRLEGEHNDGPDSPASALFAVFRRGIRYPRPSHRLRIRARQTGPPG